MINKVSSQSHYIKTNILFMFAYRNLLSKKLRSSLTIMGIAIGIGAVYFLLSFGLGIQKLVATEVIGNQSIRTIDITPANSSIVKLDDVSFERIKHIAEVKDSGVVYYFPGSYKIDNSESDAIAYGIDQGYERLTNLNLIEGKLLSESDQNNSMIVNTALLQAIGINSDTSKIIGKTIEVVIPLSNLKENLGTFKKEFVVVGVIDSGSGAEFFIPSTFFRDLGVPSYTQAKIGVDDVGDVTKARTQIESLGFNTSSPVDTLNDINRVFTYFTYILVGFGSIGMIIAILGMFNTLTISLLERTKEIGLMVALGARSLDMSRLFIFEALLLAVIGSTMGIVGAITLGQIINFAMNILAAKRGVTDHFTIFANPSLLILSVSGFMVLVGLLVVIMPAQRARNINPIDALRRE